MKQYKNSSAFLFGKLNLSSSYFRYIKYIAKVEHCMMIIRSLHFMWAIKIFSTLTHYSYEISENNVENVISKIFRPFFSLNFLQKFFSIIINLLLCVLCNEWESHAHVVMKKIPVSLWEMLILVIIIHNI